MSLTFEEKYNTCATKCQKLLDEIHKIDPTLKVLLIVDNGEISLLQSSNPKDLSEAFGLIEVTKLRIQEQERRIFNRRADVQDHINRSMKESNKKEIMN